MPDPALVQTNTTYFSTGGGSNTLANDVVAGNLIVVSIGGYMNAGAADSITATMNGVAMTKGGPGGRNHTIGYLWYAVADANGPCVIDTTGAPAGGYRMTVMEFANANTIVGGWAGGGVNETGTHVSGAITVDAPNSLVVTCDVCDSGANTLSAGTLANTVNNGWNDGNLTLLTQWGLANAPSTTVGFSDSATASWVNVSLSFKYVAPPATAPTLTDGGTLTDATHLLFSFNPQGAACTVDASKFATDLQATLGSSVLTAVIASGTTNPQAGTLTLANPVPPGVTVGLVLAASAITNVNGNSTAGTFTTANQNATPFDITSDVRFTATGTHSATTTISSSSPIFPYLTLANAVELVTGAGTSLSDLVIGDSVDFSIVLALDGTTVMAAADTWTFTGASNISLGLGLGLSLSNRKGNVIMQLLATGVTTIGAAATLLCTGFTHKAAKVWVGAGDSMAAAARMGLQATQEHYIDPADKKGFEVDQSVPSDLYVSGTEGDTVRWAVYG